MTASLIRVIDSEKSMDDDSPVALRLGIISYRRNYKGKKMAENVVYKKFTRFTQNQDNLHRKL